ncbi:VOC family protein [Actinocorallia sp. API 0066]|uniref:VOC family protein n=1 Tax=Actinocorallia sp. API 0066 TaxID=2896846 RepID=UPI001E508822|nr:VOC family protein [Actinocorallia sp. API 0066]MCD0448881.1 VOC family protein [Actinocorallia sp. API 0066]
MRIKRLDHLVLTVADPDRTTEFYTRVLGMRDVTFGSGRRALAFGEHRINLRVAGRERGPEAARPTPGSADLCLLLDGSLDDASAALARHGVPVEVGPVERDGALSTLVSLYVRDPDGNLIELSVYPGADDD